MDDLAKLNIDEFLDSTAGRTPTPGGGSVSGAGGALACALARMVAAYSVGKKTEPATREKIEELGTRLLRADQLLRALITRDAVAYTEMTQASKAAKEDPSLKERYGDAVLAAVAVPMEIGAIASNALAAMDELKAVSNPHLLCDLGIAAVLADASARAARYTVRVNVPELQDPALRARILAEIDDVVGHCEKRRVSVEAFVGDRL